MRTKVLRGGTYWRAIQNYEHPTRIQVNFIRQRQPRSLTTVVYAGYLLKSRLSIERRKTLFPNEGESIRLLTVGEKSLNMFKEKSYFWKNVCEI